MFIKKLIIKKYNGTIIREVNFRKGFNCIVDDSSSNRHNNVGKTTFLRLIDILMGSKDIDSIYKDSEIGSVNNELKDFIDKNKVQAQLLISSSFNSEYENDLIELKVDLFDKGNHYINNEEVSKKTYKESLRVILFKKNDEKPTFRQLIPSFIRISTAKEETKFLRNLNSTSNTNYRMIYDYLFNVGDYKADNKKEKIKKELKSLKVYMNELEKRSSVKNLRDLEESIEEINKRVKVIKTKLLDIVSNDYFRDNKEKISKYRNEYNGIYNDIDRLNYEIKMNNVFLENLTQQSKNDDKNNIYLDFYNEIRMLLPSIDKDFNDLLVFNRKLMLNRIKHLKNLNNDLIKEKNDKEDDLKALERDNMEYISLVNNDEIDDYLSLEEKLIHYQNELSEKQALYKSITSCKSDIERYKDKLDELINNYDIDQNRIDLFNSYFSSYTDYINGEILKIKYNDELKKFPIDINNVRSSSEGSRKSMIAAYDLAYQDYAKEINKVTPRFIVHDLIENIESDVLGRIIEKVELSESQFIVSVLNEHLENSLENTEFDSSKKDEFKILKLSSNDKLFKV